ncbi:hypothetical protein BC831DRAFT_264342 [Entophlyctis helioformis]|nr:hypothetical protein BC831DRAFT_264342 [Entophlyctis helioformis]
MARCEWMSSGYRQKFSVVQRGDLITWALDNVKTFEPCKEIKALMDSGIPESELPDTSMARLVKLWMIVCKQEGVETKNAIKSQKETGDLAAGAAADSGGSGSAGAGGGDPSKGANGGAAGAAGAAGAKQGAKTDKDKDKERAKSSNVKKPAVPAVALQALAALCLRPVLLVVLLVVKAETLPPQKCPSRRVQNRPTRRPICPSARTSCATALARATPNPLRLATSHATDPMSTTCSRTLIPCPTS